jgi:hypothetical protein
MLSLGIPPTDTVAPSPTSAEPSESLLDEEDEDEVLVLDPPLEPTPADAPTASCSNSENNKVNDESVNITIENYSEDEDMSSQNTCTTIFTKYSKYGIREGYDYSETEHDPESDRPQLGSLYHQCKTARAASLAYSCTNVELGKETGTTKTVNFSSIGSLNCIGDSEVLNTFRGSRLNSNNTDVNQNISLSFDPATLTCVSCSSPHPILQTGAGGSPPIIVLSDQNFLPTLNGGESCVSIIRLEDSSLEEIVDLTIEILDRSHVPTGTIFLLCSASHLNNVGSSIYAADWCTSVAKFSAKI